MSSLETLGIPIEKPRGVRTIEDKEFVIIVTKEWRNKLIGRLEVDGYIYHIGKGTPSRSKVKEVLAKAYNTSTDLIAIRRLETEYGWGRTILEAHIYDDKETLFKFEPRYILIRDGIIKKEEKEGKE